MVLARVWLRALAYRALILLNQIEIVEARRESRRTFVITIRVELPELEWISRFPGVLKVEEVVHDGNDRRRR